MILPILVYGHDMLRRKCDDIAEDYPLEPLVTNMWETLYNAAGCGLAAPQIGEPVNLFLVDSKLIFNHMDPESRLVYFEDNNGVKEVFINTRIIASSERKWESAEACLSIPGLQYEAERPWSVTIEYLDKYFKPNRRTISGITARMILHEYEHTQGILYLDHLPVRRQKRLSGKLDKISKGKVNAPYPMSFAGK